MHNATRLAAADVAATSIAASLKSELQTSQFCSSRVLSLKPQKLL